MPPVRGGDGLHHPFHAGTAGALYQYRDTRLQQRCECIEERRAVVEGARAGSEYKIW